MGWRLPHYGLDGNTDRENLERLTGNVLGYLAAGEWHGDIGDSRTQALKAELARLKPEPMRRAIEDLSRTFPDDYPNGEAYLKLLDGVPALLERVGEGDEAAADEAREVLKRLEGALLENPLLDFERLLVVKRSPGNLGLPQNWQSNSSLPLSGFDNELAVLEGISPEGELTTVYRPENPVFVGDVDLHFEAGKVLFSSVGDNNRWQVFEMNADGTGLTQLPFIYEPDVDNYDACYLPDDDIIFTSTAPFVGVPCVTGASHVANLFRYDRKTGDIRQLSFGQDHDWCPTVLNNGKLLYLRWEYADIPHFVSRILFHMNPDGTEQFEYYGSNSYWPNAMFYARPIPDHPTKFVAVVGGHHDNPRMGELVLFDSNQGKQEADGVIQRIPGSGKKVEPIILDGLTSSSWPKYLHPYPLSDKYFLSACRPTAGSRWGIYLVDVFDNITLIKEADDGYALLEPLPLRKTKRPPVIPGRVEPERKDASVYMADVHIGGGLKGVPRGSVKKLRLLTYHWAYHGMGGQVNRVGYDGPWDVKRIIGTVPVEADGSAFFKVPANTPISVQPLDEKGQAVQLMRSWMTAMPGEVLSCVGCHETQATAPDTNIATLASKRAPSEIAEWYGPTRGFSFRREVQPVLDKYCVSCHDGSPRPSGPPTPDLRPSEPENPPGPAGGYQTGSKFSRSYMALRSLVRAATIESDIHMLPPGEFSADTTRLVQMLRKGHHGVELDGEAWDRLTTWIDLNAPEHGTWHENVGHAKVDHMRDRRKATMTRYAGIDEDAEAIGEPADLGEPVAPGEIDHAAEAPTVAGWPFGAAEAERKQGDEVTRTVELADGITLELVRVPAGEFAMGDADGCSDEAPVSKVALAEPLWVGRFEVTNQQFALFDPDHDSRLEHGDFLQFGTQERGYPVNAPTQPVSRVSWDRAQAFCEWLSEKTGERFALPTEAQWEWACRAGTATPLSFGDTATDFAKLANLADQSLRHIDTFAPWVLPSGALMPWRKAAETVNDGHRVSAPVGSYEPNAWGLHDMHGNVAEWTRSPMRPYPYADSDAAGEMVVRGGSWYDVPDRARSAFRQAYPHYRGVYDVGFRVVAVM